MTNEKFFLDCPFEEKDMCKRNGALWDPDKKKWFVPSNLDPKAFKRWWPKNEVQKKKTHLRIVK